MTLAGFGLGVKSKVKKWSGVGMQGVNTEKQTNKEINKCVIFLKPS